VACTGAEDATAPTNKVGYFCLNHADRAPAYDPPKDTQGLAAVRLYAEDTMLWMDARSAKACSVVRYCKLARLTSENGWELPACQSF
jgi:hypothetical protein